MSGSPDLLFDELLYEIEQRIIAHPRSQQTRVGPSELGMPCDRRLAHKLAGTPEATPRGAAWLPTIGTAVHSWLEGALQAASLRWLQQGGTSPRYIVEGNVVVGQVGGVDIDGHTDAYDTVTATVIDWKTVGKTTLDKARRHGASEQYRRQAHLYGRGWVAKGYPVDTVMVVYLPRNAELKDAVVWHEPYDEQVALDTLKRANRLHALVTMFPNVAWAITNGELQQRGLGVLARPGADVSALAIDTDAGDCRFCPYLRTGSTDLRTSCPGDATRVAATTARAEQLAATADVFG